jgi:hypothetical protein
MPSYCHNEEQTVRCRIGIDEVDCGEEGGEPSVPRAWSLFQATEVLVELAHTIAVNGVHEAGWLASVDVLVDEAVEEGVVDVQLVHQPGTRACQCQDSANRR